MLRARAILRFSVPEEFCPQQSFLPFARSFQTAASSRHRATDGWCAWNQELGSVELLANPINPASSGKGACRPQGLASSVETWCVYFVLIGLGFRDFTPWRLRLVQLKNFTQLLFQRNRWGLLCSTALQWVSSCLLSCLSSPCCERLSSHFDFFIVGMLRTLV